MNIKVTNARQVAEILENAAPKAAKNLARSTVHGVAGVVVKDIKATAPDDPATKRGDLKRSVKAKRERVKGSYFSSTVRIGAFYWWFLEKGTIKLGARNFVRKSAEKTRPDLPKVFREEFGKKLAAMIKRANK